MNKSTKIICGLVLVLTGVMLTLRAFDVVPAGLFFPGWWTLTIIIPSLVGLITEREKSLSILGLVVGVLLCLACNSVISGWLIVQLIIPTIAITVGVALLFAGLQKKHNCKPPAADTYGRGVESFYTCFSASDICFDDEYFEGAQITATFGGVKCDLRNAYFSSDCVIDATVNFGGISILVPDDVNVAVDSAIILGATSCRRRKHRNDNAHTLFVNSSGMFGGVDIK